jgi:hypothetical protein
MLSSKLVANRDVAEKRERAENETGVEGTDLALRGAHEA